MIRKEKKEEKRNLTAKKTSAAKGRTETKVGRYVVKEDAAGRFSSRGAAAVAPEERRPKNVMLTHGKVAHAKDLLGARTESEAIEIALERLIDEESHNREAWSAHEAFAFEMVENGFEIEDVFGRLED